MSSQLSSSSSSWDSALQGRQQDTVGGAATWQLFRGKLSLVETPPMLYGFGVILFLVSPWKGWLFKLKAHWFSQVHSFPNWDRRSHSAALPLPVRNEVWFPFPWVRTGLWPGWPPQALCVGTSITDITCPLGMMFCCTKSPGSLVGQRRGIIQPADQLDQLPAGLQGSWGIISALFLYIHTYIQIHIHTYIHISVVLSTKFCDG